MKKVYYFSLIILIIISLFTSNVYGKEIVIKDDEYQKEEKIHIYDSDVKMVQTSGHSNLKFSSDPVAFNMWQYIFGVVQYVCLGAIFAILLIKGVQFMSAAPEGKAEIKKQIVAIAIGAFIVFCIRGIIVIISNLNLF